MRYLRLIELFKRASRDVWCPAKDYNIVKVDESKLRLNAKKNDVHGVLEGVALVAMSEGHFGVWLQFRVQGKSGLVFVAIFQFALAVFCVTV